MSLMDTIVKIFCEAMISNVLFRLLNYYLPFIFSGFNFPMEECESVRNERQREGDASF